MQAKILRTIQEREIQRLGRDHANSVPSAGLGGKTLDEVESQAIIETLEQTQGNESEAAKLLNITRTTLNNKLKKIQYFGLSGSV